MKLLADMHISPATVEHLRGKGHDVVRVNEVLPSSTSDNELITWAGEHARAILTQDLEFANLIVLARRTAPSLITLRLATSRIDYVNSVLDRALPELEQDVRVGSIVTITDTTMRRRSLPIS